MTTAPQTAPEAFQASGWVPGRPNLGNAVTGRLRRSESSILTAPATCAALCAGYGGLETAARAVWPGLEVMMGLPDGHVTDHTTRRADALRILGNGVVPQQAAHAIATLLDRLEANP